MNELFNVELNFQVQIETGLALPEARISQAIEWLAKQHDVESGIGISVVITSDEEIRRLNRQFRAVDAPTDVLSFPADPLLVPEDEEDEGPYLGDLVLGLPYIQRQAEADKHTLADELVLAVIHGTLHLLGYDHDTAQNQSEMWAIQSDALQVMGVPIEVPLFQFPDEESDQQGD